VVAGRTPAFCYNVRMDLVAVDHQSAVAPFEQVRAQIAAAIESGTLEPADRLPTVRALAAHLGLAVNTVARSYRELEMSGLIETNGRHGTVVAGDTAVARRQAVIEAREFLVRMRQLGVGEAEMMAILRRQTGTPDGT
jgi:DNA-binding transcriptional regulator YhcF (GntR family)